MHMQHGYEAQKFRTTCSTNMQHDQAAWKSSRDMHTPYSRPYFSPWPVDLDSGSRFPVWCSKGRKNARICAFFFRSLPLSIFALDFLTLPRSFLCFKLASGEEAQVPTSDYNLSPASESVKVTELELNIC